MPALSIETPFPVYPDVDGDPLDDGYIYIGLAGAGAEASPITAYWDNALTIPAAQPIRTINGYPSNAGTPGRLYVNADDYSITVRNKNSSLVYSSLNVLAKFPFSLVTGQLDSARVDFTQSGTGAVLRTAKSKFTDRLSVKDFGAVGDGVTNDTVAIQAAHDAAVAQGLKSLMIPSGKYVITNLSVSPLVTLECEGNVIFLTSITSGNCIHVSTEFGNWTIAQDQIDFAGNIWVVGKLNVFNTTGGLGNTATGVFFGDPGVASYSAESLSIYGLSIKGFHHSHRFGTHSYLINFYGCEFRKNRVAIYNDHGLYIDRTERMSYFGCTLAENDSVLDGDSGHTGDFVFSQCSIDYNVRMLANTPNNCTITLSGGCHIETADGNRGVSGIPSETFFQIVGDTTGCVVNLDNYYLIYLGSSPPAILAADVGALGRLNSSGMTLLTATGATLFNVSSSTGYMTLDNSYTQRGGAASNYYTNTGGGGIEQNYGLISGSSQNFEIGTNQNLRAKLTEVYTAEFTKAAGIGATVDLFSVGPVVSWATGRLTVHSTSAGIVTVKIVDFSIIGGAVVGGSAVVTSEDYGGGSAFTVGEVQNSPSSGYNKLTLTNISGVACTFSCSLLIFKDSRAPTASAITLL